MRFFPRLAAAFVLLALLIITPRQARSADARTVHKQIGVHAGLCVLLGNNPIERALALAKVSDLVIYVPTRTHAEATTSAAPAMTIRGRRCSSLGWHARAAGAFSHSMRRVARAEASSCMDSASHWSKALESSAMEVAAPRMLPIKFRILW